MIYVSKNIRISAKILFIDLQCFIMNFLKFLSYHKRLFWILIHRVRLLLVYSPPLQRALAKIVRARYSRGVIFCSFLRIKVGPRSHGKNSSKG